MPAELFAGQLFEFMPKVNRHDEEVAARTSIFAEHLSSVEKSHNISIDLPSGRSLSELHASPIVHLASRATYYLQSRDDFNEYMWCEPLARDLLGLPDYEILKRSPGFQAWYSAVVRPSLT